MLWSNRGRRHGWPSSETIQEVLTTGCDLIPESHRDYSHDRFSMEIFVCQSGSDPGEKLDNDPTDSLPDVEVHCGKNPLHKLLAKLQ